MILKFGIKQEMHKNAPMQAGVRLLLNNVKTM